jgi:RNA-directed DNA polymerase
LNEETQSITNPEAGMPVSLAINRQGLPDKVFQLRKRLYLKAKQEPDFRFYALYDRIYRPDVLAAAWDQVAENGGAPGVDGVTIEAIEKLPERVEGFLRALQEDLKAKRYKPRAVKRVDIPKADGGKRPLGIPTVRDRVVQTAVKLILEPIFEADFMECSYGFRPDRNAHQALKVIRKGLSEGKRAVYDADLKGYFDSIPHDKLMRAVEKRISDGAVLKLIWQWLKTPVQEPGDRHNPPRNRKPTQGTPQGGVISPLLANLYLHWLDRGFHARGGPAHWAKAELVRYADDFVVLARYQGERLRNWLEERLEGRMGLTLNRHKTRVVNLNEAKASLDFLGYTYRYDQDRHGHHRRYVNQMPSRKACARQRAKLRALFSHRHSFVPVDELIRRANRQLQGWAGYFGQGYPRQAFRNMNHYTRERLVKHLKRRSQRPYRPPVGVSWYTHVYQNLGLIQL